MCCIFTCCGWLIDLLQRAWVFAMSFCMSGAVCCVLMLGSMSGVALGYNYSLAEYMDLKETNVSVYLKRGVFDDEGMSDDMNFRRSGEEEGPEQMPIGQRRFGGNQDDSNTLSSGRRLDDSLLQSNQNHGYEGGLMKLTLAPPFPITTTTPMPLTDLKVDNIFMKHAPGSINQLKDIQSLINYRKALAAREPGKPGDPLIAGYPASLISEQSYVPPHILNAQPSPGRRAWQAPSTNPGLYNTWQDYLPGKMHPALMAVPPPGVRERQYWEAFKQSSPQFIEEYRILATSPQAIRLNTLGLDMFPTEPPKHPTFTEETDSTTQQTPSQKFMNIGLDSGGGQFEQKMILDKYGASRTKPYETMRGKDDSTPKSDNEYYDDDIKGLPVRKKRHVHGIKWKSNGQNVPGSEQEKSDSDNSDKMNDNDIANTDPSILVSKLESKYTVSAEAGGISKLESKYTVNAEAGGISKLESKYTVNAEAGGISKLESKYTVNAEAGGISKLESKYTVNAEAGGISKLESKYTVNAEAGGISKLESKYPVNAEAGGISKLEKTPLLIQLINNKVYETESRILMRGLLGKSSRSLHKINNKLNDTSSADPNFINQRRYVFSFV